jgi:hypothetical protein
VTGAREALILFGAAVLIVAFVKGSQVNVSQLTGPAAASTSNPGNSLGANDTGSVDTGGSQQ